MPSIDGFKQRYPEFNKVDDDIVSVFIEDAQAEISKQRWGRLYRRGVLALAAHLLRLNQLATQSKGDSVKIATSKSAGELSVDYAAPTVTGTDADYQLTAYGQEYLRLRKLIGVGVMVA